jgi:hypothetical protein
VNGLEVVDFPRLAQWGRTIATIPYPLHGDMRFWPPGA